jgi:hypothetical protein
LDKPDRHQRPGKQGVWCGVPTHRPTCCRAGWTHISLPWWRGVGGRCGARGVRRGAVCRPAPPVCLTWVFGVTSWAAVLLSIKPVVASGEWSSPVDQDHPGELWPGSRTSVFFGLTPAAGPGVVVTQIARAADHCVTGIEWQDETFGRLNRENLIGEGQATR